MRILFLTNFYPPHNFGGMELSCKSVVDGFGARNHQTRVLTSTYGLEHGGVEGHVARLLRLEMDFMPLRNAWDFFIYRKKHEQTNRTILKQQIADFCPDALFIWGMWNLNRSLAMDAEMILGEKVLYRFADYWAAMSSQFEQYWRQPGMYFATKTLRRLLSPLALYLLNREEDIELAFQNSFCVSEALRRKLVHMGVPITTARVIPTGFDLTPFLDLDIDEKWRHVNPTDLLFVGRLIPEKGLHVALKTLALLINRAGENNWRLTIAGKGNQDDIIKLESSIATHGLKNVANFIGHVPTTEIPKLMQRHGTVIVPSLWEDPLPRVAIEAFAAGCVVVGSDIGGLPEIIDHGHTGFLVTPGNPEDIAECLAKLAFHPNLCMRVASEGRRYALSNFTLEQMLDKVEELLHKVADR